MDDLVERLITARDDDHERGCQMRFVVCSCGYGDQTARAVGDAKDRIEALQAALEWYAEQVAGCRKITREGTTARNKLDADGGKIARQALKGTDNAE